MEKLPEPDVKMQRIAIADLPAGSYVSRYSDGAWLQPFEVHMSRENNCNSQLNWTNHFLLMKLGLKTLTPANIKAISRISTLNITDEASFEEVIVLATKMSDELAAIKDRMFRVRTQADLDNIKESIAEVVNELDVRTRLSLLEAKMDRIERLLLGLANK